MTEFLETKILEFGNYSLYVYNLVSLIIYIGFATLFFVIINRLIYRSTVLDPSKKFSISRIVKYLVILVSFLISLHLLGFNVSVLLAGSAALLVGAGFGLQYLLNDFVSGIILLLDGTLKVGDIIEVNSMIYQVIEINYRTTTLLGRDDNYVIVPNSELTRNRIINWTHNNIVSRFKVTVGVDYSSDVATVMRIMKEVAMSHEKVLKNPEPFVRLEDYGENAIIFSVYFFTEEVFRVENVKSDIRVALFKAFQQHGITIPLPQRVLHFSDAEKNRVL